MGIRSSKSSKTMVTAVDSSVPAATAASKANESDLWVTIKARTTCKRTRAVDKKHWAFRASAKGVVLGAGRDCDIVVADASLAAAHCRISLTEGHTVQLAALARVYMLIGQGLRNEVRPARGAAHNGVAVDKDCVIKMGACSLAVTDICIASSGGDGWAQHMQMPVRPSTDVMCYICFDDTNESDNALVPSPCVCGKLVHRACLSKWIAAKGSRLCSICKSKLPIEFTVDPPYLVLSVVRHMRGLHWNGEREYIISFKNRAMHSVTIGSGPDCDLSLPDPSLSRAHSRLTFHGPAPTAATAGGTTPARSPVHSGGGSGSGSSAGHFVLEDMNSSAGTFIKLMGPHQFVADGNGAAFKIGRTMISIKVRRRRPGGSLLSGEAWRSPASPGSTPASPGAASTPPPPAGTMISPPTSPPARGRLHQTRSAGVMTPPSAHLYIATTPSLSRTPASVTNMRTPLSGLVSPAMTATSAAASPRSATSRGPRVISAQTAVDDLALTGTDALEDVDDDAMLAAVLIASAREYAALANSSAAAAVAAPAPAPATGVMSTTPALGSITVTHTDAPRLTVSTAAPAPPAADLTEALRVLSLNPDRPVAMDGDPEMDGDDDDLPDIVDFDGDDGGGATSRGPTSPPSSGTAAAHRR